MTTAHLAEENFRRLRALFPHAVTESVNAAGEVVRAIDADVLRQEIAAAVVEGAREPYRFTWPGKRRALAQAFAPCAKTLCPVREKSVGRRGARGGLNSENLYIEGDNLDALKLLRETHGGKIKLIYIDPPYNTGSDFVYKDDFSRREGQGRLHG
ncbi:MAG: site-specific DNA-methyltransferase, partial [Ottowia sp.]|nr:site-specific DNA-methyltransferase [Ottowia sp.]